MAESESRLQIQTGEIYQHNCMLVVFYPGERSGQFLLFYASVFLHCPKKRPTLWLSISLPNINLSVGHACERDMQAHRKDRTLVDTGDLWVHSYVSPNGSRLRHLKLCFFAFSRPWIIALSFIQVPCNSTCMFFFAFIWPWTFGLSLAQVPHNSSCVVYVNVD